MKLNNEQQARSGERGLKGKCAPKSVCGISMACCLCCCLLPGIGLLAYTYMSYGNFVEVQGVVVGQEHCGYYRRNLKRLEMNEGGNDVLLVEEEDTGKEPRQLKKSGSYSSGTSSSTNKKQNHYRMTYRFETLDGENVTTAAERCLTARRAMNQTYWIYYDPDDPGVVVDDTRISGYLVLGVCLAAAGGVLLCAACIFYKFFMNTFGTLIQDLDNTENSSNSNYGAAAGIAATTGLAAAAAIFANNNTSNSDNNTSNTPNNNGGSTSTFSNPNAGTTTNSTVPNNPAPSAPTETPSGYTPSYGNGTTNSNTYSDSNNYSTNAYYSNTAAPNPYGNSGSAYNSDAPPTNNNFATSAPTNGASVSMSGYQPP